MRLPVACRPTLRLPALAAAALLVGACGSTVPPALTPTLSMQPVAVSPAPSSTAAPSPSAAADATLLLEVRFGGGFINPAASIGALPVVVVDTAGRFYLPDTTLGGSMIPKVLVRDTGSAGAAAVLDAARKAGLVDGSAGSAGGVGMPDTGGAIVTLEVDGKEIVTRVTGPGGPVPGGVGGPGVSLAPGATDNGSPNPGGGAVDLIAQLTDTSLAWGGSSAPATTFEPTAYRVWVAPASGGSPAPPWPLAADPATFGAPVAANFGVDGLRSGIVSGADAVKLAQTLASVHAGSQVTANGAWWQLWVSPVLPAATGG